MSEAYIAGGGSLINLANKGLLLIQAYQQTSSGSISVDLPAAYAGKDTLVFAQRSYGGVTTQDVIWVKASGSQALVSYEYLSGPFSPGTSNFQNVSATRYSFSYWNYTMISAFVIL
jgi:hypothetical protein